MTITELVNWSDKTSSLTKLENGYHFGGTELDDFEKSWDRPYGRGDYGFFGKNKGYLLSSA